MNYFSFVSKSIAINLVNTFLIPNNIKPNIIKTVAIPPNICKKPSVAVKPAIFPDNKLAKNLLDTRLP